MDRAGYSFKVIDLIITLLLQHPEPCREVLRRVFDEVEHCKDAEVFHLLIGILFGFPLPLIILLSLRSAAVVSRVVRPRPVVLQIYQNRRAVVGTRM